MTFLYTGFVDDKVAEHLLTALDACKEENYVEDIKRYCTVGGVQTRNVVDRINSFVLNELFNPINAYINTYYEQRLEYFRYHISHVHLLDYAPGGYQQKHTHHATEDHSFIIYLNDSDGATRFYIDEKPIDIKSDKNKICVFNAVFLHEGLVCSDRRVLAVGAIKFDHKIWR